MRLELELADQKLDTPRKFTLLDPTSLSLNLTTINSVFSGERMRLHVLAIILGAIFFVAASARADVSFAGLPPATSVSQARTQRIEVRKRLIESAAARPLVAPPTPPKDRFDSFAETMISRLLLKKDLAAVSANLLTPSFQPWLTGTDMALFGSVCQRVGDYDFVMMSLLHMAYIDNEAGRTLLTEPARRKLRDVLLSERGVDHHIKFTFNNCPKLIKITDSENHILMTETARYLTNQLIFDETGNAAYDNSKNGFDEWFAQHMSQFLRNDFSELNSRPYQGYTMIALTTLYSYARGERVKTTARMIMDYIAAKSAVQSTGLRRRAPFRRQKEWRDSDELMMYENTMPFLAPETGNYTFIPLQDASMNYKGGTYMMFMSAIDKYEVPDSIVDLFVSPTPQFQMLHHRDVEIYAPSTNFLISAGGRFRSEFGYFTGQNDEWAVSTIVIPAHSGLKRSEMFYIDGPPDFEKKNNLCVAPGFACGENFHAPMAPTAVVNGWQFFDTPDFYLAAFEQKPYVMIEVRERDTTFAAFQTEVLKNVLTLKKGALATYRSSTGRTVSFTPESGKLGRYPIASINGHAQEQETSRWPLARGTILKSSGDGLITIDNPKTRERLVLDGRNIQAPTRSLERY